MKEIKENYIDVLIMITLLLGATLLGWFFQKKLLHNTNIAVVYILSVLLIARCTKGYFFGIISSVLSILLFNWFFTEPYFTLKVNDITYIITFIIMATTSIIMSTVTSKVKYTAQIAKIREKENDALYQMTNHLTYAKNENEIASVIVDAVSTALICNAACIIYDENGLPETTFLQQIDVNKQIRLKLNNFDNFKQIIESSNNKCEMIDGYYNFLIRGTNSILAVVRVPEQTYSNLDENKKRILFSIIESSSLALERFRSLKTQAKIQEEAIQERYRGNLLRSISHDIRTPLSGIMGVSEMIAGISDKNDPRYEMANQIYKETNWLYALVENILNLTKLQDGKLVIEKQIEAVEEVVGAALVTISKRMPEREIKVIMPDELIMIPMDAKLINQVLVNLIDNAIKHTRDCDEISLEVIKVEEEQVVKFIISDCGSGIKDKDIPHIFQMFYTTRGKMSDAKRGLGLGLAICQTIIEAHGGKISAENRTDVKGAKFIFTLPLGGETNAT